MNKAVWKELLNTVLYILVVLAATWLLITFVVQRTRVEGESMEPTLQDGDSLFVDKMTYRFKDPERYDIIVFPPYEDQKGVYYIKRIIGLPGETIQITEDGTIWINGEALNDVYGKEVIASYNIGTTAVEPLTLGDDEYFVMGDNRNNSLDSRSSIVGNVKRAQITGRAWIRIWPLESFGLLEHGDT